MIYFDNSATTAIHKEALDTYMKTSQRFVGNPSSLHRLGENAHRLLSKGREQVAELLGVEPAEIFFTSCGTEGNNWVIKGTAIEKAPFGKHIILSSIEHPSVGKTCEQLEQLGFEVSHAPVDANGIIDVDALKGLLRPDTILVSTMAVNNETGSRQPILEISQVLAEYPTIHYHVDAVQAVGKIPVAEWLTERVDFVTLSAHKFHGPRGVGILYRKHGTKLAPLLTGGGQENNQRSGTENVPGIISTAKALRISLTDDEYKAERVRHLKNSLIDALKEFPKVSIYTNEASELSAPHIICFGLQGIRGEVMVHAFEEKDIYISTTSACSSKKKMNSSTLISMGVAKKDAETAVRISLDETNTMTEVEQFLTVFNQLYKKFAKLNG